MKNDWKDRFLLQRSNEEKQMVAKVADDNWGNRDDHDSQADEGISRHKTGKEMAQQQVLVYN